MAAALAVAVAAAALAPQAIGTPVNVIAASQLRVHRCHHTRRHSIFANTHHFYRHFHLCVN